MRLGFARLLVVVAAWTLGTLAWASLWVQTQEIDFIGNQVATEGGWYYGTTTPNGGGTYPEVEWIFPWANYLSAVRVVYIRGQSIVFTTKLKNLYHTEVQGFFHVDNPRLESPAGYNRPSAPTYNLVPSEPEYVVIPPGGTVTVTTTLDNMPNFVAYGNLRYEARLMSISGPSAGTDVLQNPGPLNFRTYLIDTSSVGLQSVPWTDVLEYSCDFAFFGVGADDVSDRLCKGLYWSGRVFRYNLHVEYVPANWYRSSLRYKLWPLLLALADGPKDGNCMDISGFLEVLNGSHGVSGSVRRIKSPSSDPNYDGYIAWMTNPVAPIGWWSPHFEYYVRLGFDQHQVFARGSWTYDAALAYFHNLSAVIFKSPANGWVFGGYWQTFIPSDVYGHAFRALLSSDSWQQPSGNIPFPHFDTQQSNGSQPINVETIFNLPLQEYVLL